MTVTVVLRDQLADQLFKATEADAETACVLLARRVRTPEGNVRLLAREVHWVPDAAYLVRNATELSIVSSGYVPALAAAEADQSVPIWLHTHPGRESSPRPSERDKVVDKELADVFRLRSGSPFYGAIVLARREGRPCFTGHIESDNERAGIDRMWVTGRRFALYRNWLDETTRPSEQFDQRTADPIRARVSGKSRDGLFALCRGSSVRFIVGLLSAEGEGRLTR